MKKLLLITISLWLATTPAIAQKTVATAGDIKITDIQLKQFIQTLPPESQTSTDTATLQRIINILIQRSLLEKQAIKEKVHQKKEVKELLDTARQTVIADYYLQEIIREQITDKDMEVAYREYSNAVPELPEIKARHILVETEAEAKDIITRLQNDEDFATLARSLSTGPSAQQGGDLGYFTQDRMVPEFAKAVGEIKVGEFGTTPTKTQFGWHVILVEDKRTNAPLSLEDIRPQLEQALFLTKLEEVLQSLTADIEIKYEDLENLDLN